jgi:hypothetical protein
VATVESRRDIIKGIVMNHFKDLYFRACSFLAAKRDYAMAVVLGAMASSASAQSNQGWLGLVRNFTTLGRETIALVTVGFFVLGLCAIGYGGKLLWDKSNDRDDVKMSKVVWCFAGGMVMCAIGFFAAMSVITAGGSEADMGRRINIQ